MIVVTQDKAWSWFFTGMRIFRSRFSLGRANEYECGDKHVCWVEGSIIKDVFEFRSCWDNKMIRIEGEVEIEMDFLVFKQTWKFEDREETFVAKYKKM